MHFKFLASFLPFSCATSDLLAELILPFSFEANEVNPYINTRIVYIYVQIY